MLFNSHVGELDALAELRNGESLAAFDLSQDEILLALGQFAQKFAFHKMLTERTFEAFLCSFASRGQL